MHFVQNKNFKPVARRRQRHRINNGFAYFFHLRVAGRVQLQHVHIGALGDFLALGAMAARFRRGFGVAVAGAVKRFGQNARRGGFAAAARTVEQIRVGNAARLQRVLQRFGNAFLADHIFKLLRAVLVG